MSLNIVLGDLAQDSEQTQGSPISPSVEDECPTNPDSCELGATAASLSEEQIEFYDNGVFVDDVETLLLAC